MEQSNCALQSFSNGFNCAQSVFSAYCEKLGLDKETALKISTSFGGGMGNTGQTCGAVTGALMLIGLKHGKYLPNDNVSKEKTYALVQEFSRKFKAKNGSLNCTELLGCDIGTAEGAKYARDNQLTKKICPELVKEAANIIGQLLEL